MTTTTTSATVLPPATDPVAIAPSAPPDPIAGGNYLRDPVTGLLSLNPAHPAEPAIEE